MEKKDKREHLYAFQAYDKDVYTPSIHIAGRYVEKEMIAPYELVPSINISVAISPNVGG